MTNQSKLHPGEFSRDIAKWHRGVIADIKQLTRGIEREGTVYLPQIVLSPRVVGTHSRQGNTGRPRSEAALLRERIR